MDSLLQSLKNKRLVALLVIGIASRIVLALVCARVAGPLAFYRADTDTYVRPAQSLLHGSFLSSGRYSSEGTPETFRTPGYPLLLVPALAFNHLVIIALLENFLLAGVSIWLVWAIASRLFSGSQAAFWAALLFCFEPLGFVCSATLMSETAFMPLILLFTWALIRFLDQPSYTNLTLAAISLGSAAYIRPVPLYLCFWLVPFFLLFPRTASVRRRLCTAAVFPLMVIAVLAPWIIRNRMVAGYTGFSTAQEENLYFMSAATTVAKLENKNTAELTEQWGATDKFTDYLAVHPEQRTWTNGELANFWGTHARKIIFSHLPTYGLIHAKGCASVLLHPGATEILQSFGSWNREPLSLAGKLDHPLTATIWLMREYPAAALLFPLLIVLQLSYYALAVRGLRYIRIEMRFLLCAIFLYFLIVSGIPGNMARYRIPLMAWVCIPAGAAIAKRKSSHADLVGPTPVADSVCISRS